VRRVYLGGNIETAARPESSFRDTTTPFLEVKNVSVHYGKAQALDDVSIHVHAGEFVSVVGLNGAGKTTLFNTISGFLPYAGDIRREGASLRGFTAATIARKGIVQCPEGRELFVDMTVRENLDLGGQHLPSAECAEQIAWLFDLFPILRDRQKQAAGTLSGGEQQIADHRACADDETELLILDEPTLGLAPVIPRAIVQGAGAAAADHRDHRAARRADRHLRAAARRPRLCARTRPHRLGRRAGALRRRRRHRLSVGRHERYFLSHAGTRLSASFARRRIGAAVRPAGGIDGIDQAGAQPDRCIGAVELVIGAGIDDDLGAGAAAMAPATHLLADRGRRPIVGAADQDQRRHRGGSMRSRASGGQLG